MHKSVLMLACGLALGLLSQPSLAADIPLKAPAAAPSYDWSGFYVGVNGGAARSPSKWINLDNTTLYGDNVPPDTFYSDVNGNFFGGQIGYNIQRGPWVFGVEAMIDSADLKGDHASTAGAADDQFEARIRTLMLFTGRVGYAWDRLMVYGKAGLAAAKVEVSVSDTVAPTVGSGSSSAWRYGPAFGLGLEFAVLPNLSLAVEYDYLRLSGADYQLGDATGSYLWNVEMRDVRLLMAKLNYRFSLAR